MLKITIALLAAVCLFKLTLGQETCTNDLDCASHSCEHHGSPHCEIHDPMNQHGHCNCHSAGKRSDCHNGHQCTCNNGGDGVCNSQGHCDCASGSVGKRAAETCETGKHHQCTGTTCSAGDAVCNSQGHCECGSDPAVGKRNVRADTHCTVKADCANFACNHGQDYYCNTDSSDQGHWKCACHNHG